jgi:CheY-like chemotaxis protein
MANILIVDNYPAVGLLYREVLEEHGHQVFLASSGREALRVGRNETIDIAVVDDTLPNFSANEILTRLKHLQPGVRSILIISNIFAPAPNGKGWDRVIGKSSDYTTLRGEVDRLAALVHVQESGLQKEPFLDAWSLIKAVVKPERNSVSTLTARGNFNISAVDRKIGE